MYYKRLYTSVTKGSILLHNLINWYTSALINKVNSAYRGIYKSLQVPPKYPLLNIPPLRFKINSYKINNEAKVRQLT